ncbi:cytochrome c-type biogenesis protein CcmH/NrfF [Streptacidiphilus sp. MAP12-16]|uniref:DUF2142 domain-containing protein n=1 Tax=Streptacidiphilus sp. MAP12-16 TaxID=3156300 RepID=UPI0035119029
MSSLLGAIGLRVTASRRRVWLAGFALFFTLMACWTFASPMTAAPDEPAHITRAASVVRGEFNGPPVHTQAVIAGITRKEIVTGIRLPERYLSLNAMHACYSNKAEVPAGCATSFHGGSQLTDMTTAAGRYNPLYYLAVGWPTLFLNGVDGLYAMRLLTAAICAALLASAVVTASEWRRPGVALLGVCAAATPMVLFLGGVVNPNSVECAAGILAWASILSIFMAPDPALLKHRLARAGIASATLFCIRPLGLAWVAATVACALLVAERGTLRAVLRRRALWFWTGIAGAAFLGGEVWNLTHPDYSSTGGTPMTARQVASWTFNYTPHFIIHMVGDFGWLDAPSPEATMLLWPGVIVGLVLLAWACSRWREGVALLGIAVGIFLVPIVAGAAEAQLGPIWQGRYLLPFAAGLPILAAFAIARYEPLGAAIRGRLVALSIGLLAFADVLAFYWTLRRYLVGSNGPLIPVHAHWQPPGTWVLWTCAYALLLASQCLLVMSFERMRSTTFPRQDGLRPTAPQPIAG